MWPSEPDELDALQARLASEAPPPYEGEPVNVGGVFAAGSDDLLFAAAAVLRRGPLVAQAVVRTEARAPYVPGRLALRTGAALEAAVRTLTIRPDVLLVDATGRDHPRRAGLALQLGAALDLPTVGVTDRTLVADRPEPGSERGDAAPLLVDGRVAGFVVRTRTRTKPVVAHAAWRTDADLARRIVLATATSARTPEPLRQARRLARTERAS